MFKDLSATGGELLVILIIFILLCYLIINKILIKPKVTQDSSANVFNTNASWWLANTESDSMLKKTSKLLVKILLLAPVAAIYALITFLQFAWTDGNVNTAIYQQPIALMGGIWLSISFIVLAHSFFYYRENKTFFTYTIFMPYIAFPLHIIIIGFLSTLLP